MPFIVYSGLWATLWSGAFIATKTAINSAGPLFTVSIRCITAGILIQILTWKTTRKIPAKTIAGLILLGFLNNTGYLGLMAVALPSISTGTAAILTSTTPIVVMAFSSIQTGHYRWSQILGCVLGFLGVFGSAVSRIGSGDTSTFGIIIGVLAVLCLIFGTISTPRLATSGDIWTLTSIQSISGGVFCFVFALLLESLPNITVTFLFTQLYLVIGASVLGMTMWLKIIQKFGPVKAATAHFLPPVISIFLGAFLLNEKVTWPSVTMCVPVALGIFLITRK